jgi:hypothetical protein
MEEIKRSNESPATLASATEKLKELREQHVRDLTMMYDMHAGAYEQEALDRYLSRDDAQYLAVGENNPVLVEGYAKLDVRHHVKLYSSFFSRLKLSL